MLEKTFSIIVKSPPPPPPSYDVTFTESNLPSGVNWRVNSTVRTAPNDITLDNITSFTVYNVLDRSSGYEYEPSPSSGTVESSGHVNITFKQTHIKD